MIFSSPLFIYLFLPISLLGYYLCFNKDLRNYWLLFVSLIFFAWGGVSYTAILIGSIILNYFFGRLIEKNLETIKAWRYLFIAVACNLSLLFVFKYANFVTKSLNELFISLHLPGIHETDINLPVGISFYTFHSLSYLVDIYRKKSGSQKNIFDLALYISMFSQLIAGPIIRYGDISSQLKYREHSWTKFSQGIERFLIGLSKKVLIANVFAEITDKIFKEQAAELGALNAWLGIFCYTMQIYYDFSGYSDMAIGLGKMFGFDFMENFNFPYMSKSIQEFWRRWHISLSSFFRDYVYIPLGGNREGKPKFYRNLVIVFLLTGFWHGASWNFVAWGIFHGAFIVLEHAGFIRILNHLPRQLSKLYAFFTVLNAWVLFRSPNIHYAFSFWKTMYGFSSAPMETSVFIGFMGIEFYLVSGIAILGAMGVFKKLQHLLEKILQSTDQKFTFFTHGYQLISSVAYLTLLLLCTMYLVAGSYNPFIYYKF